MTNYIKEIKEYLILLEEFNDSVSMFLNRADEEQKDLLLSILVKNNYFNVDISSLHESEDTSSMIIKHKQTITLIDCVNNSKREILETISIGSLYRLCLDIYSSTRTISTLGNEFKEIEERLNSLDISH